MNGEEICLKSHLEEGGETSLKVEKVGCGPVESDLLSGERS